MNTRAARQKTLADMKQELASLILLSLHSGRVEQRLIVELMRDINHLEIQHKVAQLQ